MEQRLSPARKRLFTFLLLLFPFLFMILLEIGLRLGNYDGDLSLVIEKNVGGKRMYSINRDVARRYFAQAGTTIPEPHDDTFEFTKQPNTKRIFCVGESTMEGFPYEFHATAPGFLRDRLRASFPDYNVEVINVGLSAVGSYVVLDFMRELIDYEPDLFIVYVGHNEFYGAYGVGSAVTIRGGPWMTRLTLSLLKFKTFLLARNLYARLLGLLSSTESTSTATLMQQMAATKTISYGSPLYLEARDVYRKNLSRMINVARRDGVQILFSTLVSNWKDQPPFIVDSLKADSLYALGKRLYEEKNYHDARTAFLRAKDCDALRFRMTEEFQQLLIDTCKDKNISIARTDSVFAANSPHGLCGQELFLEHLHPNITGYFLMAQSFAHSIKENHLVFPDSEWESSPVVSDSTLMEQSTVGEFDWILGRIKTDLLKQRWPFTEKSGTVEFTPGNPVEALVYRYVRNEIAWSDARFALAEYYASRKRFDLARKECLAVSKVIPHHYNPLLRVADYYRMEGKREEAKAAYRRCLAAQENPYAHVKLGLTYLEEENIPEATKELEATLRSNENFREPFSLEASSNARYLLGVAYAKAGRIQEAKDQLNRAIAINPHNNDARDVLRHLSQ